MQYKIFISSVQKEFAYERQMLAKYLQGDSLLGKLPLDKCKDYGLPEPEFKMQAGFVAVIYRKKGIAFSKVGGEKDLEKDLEKLSFRAKKILHLIRKKPNITQMELSRLVGINEKNIRLNISKLKLKGLLKRIGSDKSGYWEVVDYYSKR